MKTKLWILGLAIVGFGAGLGAAHWLAGSRAEADAVRATLTARRQELTADFARQRATVTALEERQLGAQAKVDAARTPAVSPSQPANGPAARPASANPTVPKFREIVENDPGLQALWLRAARGSLAHDYGPFFANAQLTADQIDKLQTAAMKRQEQLMDLSAIGKTQGADRAAIQTLRQRANEQFEGDARDILGPDGFRQFQEYERVVPLRPMVERIAGTAALQGDPLTAAQADRLITIVAHATPDYATGARANLANVDWTAADLEAAKVLTAGQMTLFKRGVRTELQLDGALARAQQAEARPANADSDGK